MVTEVASWLTYLVWELIPPGSNGASALSGRMSTTE